MRDEIAAAVVFITRIVKKNGSLSQDQVENFSNKLTALLLEKFTDHWYQEKPLKGQGYRCIRVNSCGTCDPVLLQAAGETGLKYSDLKLPLEMTLWVDPNEVCCRFGENRGSYCTIASIRDGKLSNKSGTVDIDGALQKHESRKTTEPPRHWKDGRSRNNQWRKSPSPTQFNVNAMPFAPRYSPTGFEESVVPSHSEGDRYHWPAGHTVSAMC